MLGDLFKPRSFAGLFGAAPSVALATLALTVRKEGTHFASLETRSMILSAVAFLVYASCVSWTLMRRGHSALLVTLSFLGIWAAAAFGPWYAVGRCRRCFLSCQSTSEANSWLVILLWTAVGCISDNNCFVYPYSALLPRRRWRRLRDSASIAA